MNEWSVDEEDWLDRPGYYRAQRGVRDGGRRARRARSTVGQDEGSTLR